MDWTRQVNNYCERLDPGFWAEPVNAVTNAAFLISALVVWLLIRPTQTGERILLAVLVVIGIGSFLFHTYAQVWSAIADVIPILLFILIYLFLATRRFYAQPIWVAALAVALYVPYSAGVTWAVVNTAGPLNGSASYVPTVLIIVIYAIGLWRRDCETALGLVTGAAILALSLFFRSIDNAACEAFALGTHFMWHVLNGVMLGWMIWVMHRHAARLAPAGQQR